MIQMLVGPIANVAGQFLKNRAEKVKAKQERAVAKIQAQTKKVQSDANLEEKAIDASQDSIKDELKNKYFFTEVRYGIAFDVMTPNKLSFLGDAFNANKGYE